MSADMNFTAPAAALHPPPVKTQNPFLRYKKAIELWEKRTGTYIQWIKRLLVVTGLEAVALVVLAVYAWQAPGKIEYKPYIVEVEKAGEVRSVGVIPHGWTAETKAPVDFIIRQWLQDVRNVVDSKILWGRQWDRARAFMTTKVGNKLSSSGYAYGRDQLQKTGQVVDIEITSVLPMNADFTQASVEWTERTYSQQGQQVGLPQPWKAILQLAIYPVAEGSLKTPEQFRNTLGIFVTYYQWDVKRSDPKKVAQGGQS